MAFRLADKVKETSTTTGTGTYDLDGAAVGGFETFVAGIGTTNDTFYHATDGTDWEVGRGVVTDAATDTLSRAQILASSNGGAAVNWSAGTKVISCVIPADFVQPTPIAIAAGDETTALTVGTGKVSFRMPHDYEAFGIFASVVTAPTGAALIVDVNKNGTTIMTTDKLDIDAGEFSTATAATPPALTTIDFVAGDEVTVDVDQIGSTVAGAGLKVWLLGYFKAPVIS